MISVTAITKIVLGWLDIDEASKESISNNAGEYVGKGILGFILLIGFILLGRQLIAELRGKRSSNLEVSLLPPSLPKESSYTPDNEVKSQDSINSFKLHRP